MRSSAGLSLRAPTAVANALRSAAAGADGQGEEDAKEKERAEEKG